MNETTSGQVFRDVLRERWVARGRCVDMRDYADLPQEDRDDLEAAVQAAIGHSVAEQDGVTAGRWPGESVLLVLGELLGGMEAVGILPKSTPTCGRLANPAGVARVLYDALRDDPRTAAPAGPQPVPGRADEFARVKVRLCALITSLDETVERCRNTDLKFYMGVAHASAVGARQLRKILNDTALGTTPRPAPELAAAMAESRHYRETLTRVSEVLGTATRDDRWRIRVAQRHVKAALEGR